MSVGFAINHDMKKIVIIIEYFGEAWPEWIELFFLSCRKNPSINWLIHTDCPCDQYSYPNITFSKMTWESYKRHISDRLQITFNPNNNYKLCDIRPALGFVWEKDIASYDFYGYGDIDLIYGNLRAFLTNSVLQYNVISTHEWCFSGHLSLFKNESWIRNSFRDFSNWRQIFESQTHFRFDEDYYFRVFVKPNRFSKSHFSLIIRLLDLINPLRAKYRKLYMKEQFTTPLVPGLWEELPVKHSHTWFWRDGAITNKDNGSREFMYLHFMNFASARYMDSSYGEYAPWSSLKSVVNLNQFEAEKGFCISLDGFSKF